MTKRTQRATTVRPKADTALQPVYHQAEMPEGVDTGEASENEGVVPESGVIDAQKESQIVDADIQSMDVARIP